MYLDFDGREIRVDAENESTVRSRHTGAELRRVEVSVVAPNTPLPPGSITVEILTFPL